MLSIPAPQEPHRRVGDTGELTTPHDGHFIDFAFEAAAIAG
jgi:hypothetical protein